MKTIFATFLIVLLLIPVSAIGEIQTITHTVKQPFGGSQSPDDARISAVAKAKREALERAGVYVEALTVVKEAKVDRDEISALTAGVVKAEVVSQKNYHTEDAFGIEIIVNVVVDTSVLEERVKKLLQDRTHLAQLTETQKREKALLQKVAKLEEENRNLTAKNQSTKELKKQFQQASRGFTAVEWLNKAYALWDGGKYADPNKAIDYLNKSIALKPDFAGAYVSRGLAYYNLGKHKRAIEDYNKAIDLNPKDSLAYYSRGSAYGALGNHKQAIQDCNKAIELDPKLAEVYNNRGNAYGELGNHKQAIQDYNKAIELKPKYAPAYNNRGLAYYNLGNHNQAIQDYNKAIELNRKFAEAYYNRGLAYSNLGQYQRAIEDYDEAIRLKPDDSDAYSNRGGAYLDQGNKKLGCLDAQKACDLGNCKLLEWAKGKGECR